MGRPPSIGTIGIESRFEWPNTTQFIPTLVKQKLMGLATELAVVFFFKNFCYTFGGKKYIQIDGGPIGARLTMAVARIVMQDWKEKFNQILINSKIVEILSGLYVDDGRTVQRKLEYGERYCRERQKIALFEKEKLKDMNENRDRIELTKTEMLKAMNDVSEDLEFTMELQSDFSDNKLPTL